jgi:glutamate racemase
MIGVFDSGVGGLTVVKEIFKYLPDYQIIYFGDTARLPYGTKGAEFVKKYSAKITDWLLKKGAEIIVVACHTASAWASESLKKQFKTTPIFEVITPAAREVLDSTKNRKVGIIGTPGSIRSSAWKKKILKLNPDLETYTQSCSLFVPLVEEGWISGKVIQDVAKKYLSPLKVKKIDTLVLACTHYPLLKKIIREEMGKNVNIVNPAESVAKEIRLFLENNNQAFQIEKGKNHQFFFSDEPYNLEKISHLCFNKKIKPIVKDPFQ